MDKTLPTSEKEQQQNTYLSPRTITILLVLLLLVLAWRYYQKQNTEGSDNNAPKNSGNRPQTEYVADNKTTGENAIKNEKSLLIYLPQLNPGLVKMWLGATTALNSNNPDRVRHFSASIRELFTQAIHILAPDDEIKKWSSDPTCYDKGKPTRKARLLFIYRNISGKPLNTFIEKEIGATLEFMALFQEGTHAITASFSEHQLFALQVQAELTLKFIVEIGIKTKT